MLSLFSQTSQLGIRHHQGGYLLLLSPESGMKLWRETHDYYSVIQLVKYVSNGGIRDDVIHLVKHVLSEHHAQNELIQSYSVCIPEQVRNHCPREGIECIGRHATESE